jgi:hypothetical protein
VPESIADECFRDRAVVEKASFLEPIQARDDSSVVEALLAEPA